MVMVVPQNGLLWKIPMKWMIYWGIPMTQETTTLSRSPNIETEQMATVNQPQSSIRLFVQLSVISNLILLQDVATKIY